MVHARTIREAAVYFREQDPETCLTETAIRTLLRAGTVPSARVGKKYLVSIEALESYLMGLTDSMASAKSKGSDQASKEMADQIVSVINPFYRREEIK